MGIVGMTVVAIAIADVIVTMVGEEVLVVIASNVANRVTLPGSVPLVMVVEAIGMVAGMTGMEVGVVIVVMDLIAMGTDMVVDVAGTGEVVVAQEAIDTTVTALDHMNALAVAAEHIVLDRFHCHYSHGKLE